MFQKLIALTLAAGMAFALTACDSGSKNQTAKATQTAKTSVKATAKTTSKAVAFTGQVEPEKLEKTIGVTIELMDGRVMKGVLYPDVAPTTVENFVKLCKDNFYAGLIFHRVIPGFMIQGGGYDVDLKEKDASSIKGEFASNGVENNLKHTNGVLSMARTQVKDSASSQFFIMDGDSPHLDGEYAAFGQITEGLEYIPQISGVETDNQDNPIEPIVIKTITVQE